MLDDKDVFILDTGRELYVWIGQDTSPGESKNALSYAHVSQFLKWLINYFMKA